MRETNQFSIRNLKTTFVGPPEDRGSTGCLRMGTVEEWKQYLEKHTILHADKEKGTS
jgi:hypothetical protein